jgi:thiamine kinase-like enzyme
VEINPTLNKIICHFLPRAEAVFISPITDGLINSTFSVEVVEGAQRKKYILQKINTLVFKNPKAIQSNIVLVSRFLKSNNYPHLVLELCVTAEGNNEINFEGDSWRMMVQIENSYTVNVVENPKQAFQVGAFFGTFYRYLENIDTQQIQVVLPDFLYTKSRIDAFQLALQSANSDRLIKAQEQIEWVVKHQDLPQKWMQLQQENSLPVRLIHADPKISNVLFDATTHQPKAIIDWDTLMLGTILYDYGDMIRSYTNTKLEDDPDPEGVFNADVYSALMDGFLSEVRSILTDIELENLPYAPQVIVYIQALRFLTDYLNGDIYYQCNYPEQNLNRTKNQINLLQQILKI